MPLCVREIPPEQVTIFLYHFMKLYFRKVKQFFELTVEGTARASHRRSSISNNLSRNILYACSTSFNNFLLIYIYTYIYILKLKQFFLFTIIYSFIFYYLIYLIKNYNNRQLFILFNYRIINIYLNYEY